MQREISDRIFLGETLSPYDDARRSTAIDRTALKKKFINKRSHWNG